MPLLWLLLFFLVPFLIVLKLSFSEALLAMPPYAPLLAWTHERVLSIQLHLAQLSLSCSPTRCTSIRFSIPSRWRRVSTLLCLLLGYPMALGISARRRRRAATCC